MLVQRSTLCVLALAGLVLPGEFARAQTVLRWKFRAGQTFQVHFEQSTTTETTGAGKPAGVAIDTQMWMTWRVESVDDQGTAMIKQRFDRLSTKMRSGDATAIEFDSESAGNPTGPVAELAVAVKPLLGADFDVTMTSRGAIRDVRVPDSAAKALQAVDSAALKKILSAKGLSQVLSESAIEFPEGGLQVGATWQAKTVTPSRLGTIKQTRTFTYEGPAERSPKETVQRISIKGQLDLTPDENAKTKSKLLDQKHSGELLFDNAAGRLMQSESTQTLTTEWRYRDFHIKVQTATTSKLTLTAAKPAP